MYEKQLPLFPPRGLECRGGGGVGLPYPLCSILFLDGLLFTGPGLRPLEPPIPLLICSLSQL